MPPAAGAANSLIDNTQFGIIHLTASTKVERVEMIPHSAEFLTRKRTYQIRLPDQHYIKTESEQR